MSGREDLETRSASDIDIDLVTAALRADASDTGPFLEALAAKLEAALPGAVTVQRRRDRLLGPKRVAGLEVTAGDRRFGLTAGAPVPRATVGRVSGGITLKTDEVDVETWLRALGEALAAAAQRSQTSRQALERLLDL